jgi:hypothetical protein
MAAFENEGGVENASINQELGWIDLAAIQAEADADYAVYLEETARVRALQARRPPSRPTSLADDLESAEPDIGQHVTVTYTASGMGTVSSDSSSSMGGDKKLPFVLVVWEAT